MKEHSTAWYNHMVLLLQALYSSEPYNTLSTTLTGYWSNRKLYLQAKSVVTYDRVLNGKIE